MILKEMTLKVRIHETKNLYIVDNPVKKFNNLRVEQDTLFFKKFT